MRRGRRKQTLNNKLNRKIPRGRLKQTRPRYEGKKAVYETLYRQTEDAKDREPAERRVDKQRWPLTGR